jgi:hypothetical protein
MGMEKRIYILSFSVDFKLSKCFVEIEKGNKTNFINSQQKDLNFFNIKNFYFSIFFLFFLCHTQTNTKLCANLNNHTHKIKMLNKSVKDLAPGRLYRSNQRFGSMDLSDITQGLVTCNIHNILIVILINNSINNY